MSEHDFDFTLRGGPAIYLLHPHTPRAIRWINENLSEDRTSWAEMIPIESFAMDDIVAGIRRDGLRITGSRV